MTFREELTAAKRRIKEEREYKIVAEQRLIDGLSLEDIPKYTSSFRDDKHRRSLEWRSVRKTHLISHPKCAICGLKDISMLEVHHIMPFCLYPQLELSPDNLISLCEIGIDGCHSDFGHPLGTQSYNPYVVQHATLLSEDFSRLEELMNLAKLQAVLL